MIEHRLITDLADLLPYIPSFPMKDSDMLEVHASTGMDPNLALYHSLMASTTAYAVWKDGEPVAFYGVGPIGIGGGCPWLLTTDEAMKHPFEVGRQAHTFVNTLTKQYNFLANYVGATNTDALKLLVWLGFSISTQPVLLDHPTYEFRLFYMEGDAHV